MISDKDLIHGIYGLNLEVPQPWLETAMEITGGFEGAKYNTVTGDFDGQGISVGVLQWNYGQGSLQKKILQPFISLLGEGRVDGYFPQKVSITADMSPKAAVKYARKHMLNGQLLKPEWAAAWKNFLTSNVIKDIQLTAAGSIAAKAYQDAVSHNMRSLRAFCWFFDVYVQNGSLKGVNKPELSVAQKMNVLFKSMTGQIVEPAPVVMPFPVRDEYERNVIDNNISWDNRTLWLENSLAGDEEGIILFNWIIKRVVKNAWEADVISRKGTIAHKIGYVHGKLWDLRGII